MTMIGIKYFFCVVLLINYLMFIFASSDRTTDIDCKFEKGRSLYIKTADSYVCSVTTMKIETQGERVLTMTGKHLTNKSNAFVSVVIIDKKIANFPPRGFTAFFLNLIEFVLSYSKLQRIERSDIGDMKKLRAIDLHGNSLTALSGDLFNDLKELEYIDFEFNQISSLAENLFFYQRNLRELYFGGNHIKSISFCLLENNLKLKKIRFEGNQIDSISPGLFEKFRELYIFWLHDNVCTMNNSTQELGQVLELAKNCHRNCEGVINNVGVYKNQMKLCKLKLEVEIKRYEKMKNKIGQKSGSKFLLSWN